MCGGSAVADNGVPIECCDVSFRDAAPRYRHPACAPLMVESKGSHISCLNYVRSALGLSDACNFGPAQQVRLLIKIHHSNTITCMPPYILQIDCERHTS